MKVQMHPMNNKNHSAINHTGGYTNSLREGCACKAGPVCEVCSFCSGCSCKCHQSFTLRHRFMQIDVEICLLHGVKSIVDSEPLPFSQETVKKLEFYRPVDEKYAIWPQHEEISLISLVEKNGSKWDEISKRSGTKCIFQVRSVSLSLLAIFN
jgi:hypothetical protein